MRNPPHDDAVSPQTSGLNADPSSASRTGEGSPARAKAGKDAGARDKEISASERRCVLTGEHAPRQGLIRLALGPDGVIAPDVRARAPGRGAWIGVSRDQLAKAQAQGKLRGALMRAFRGGLPGDSRRDGPARLTIPDDLAARIENALARAALDRLGLEARASTLLTGSDRIAEAARRGRIALLLHAADAGEDGRRKLDQAWRVGLDEEGSGRVGLVLAASRSILSEALGRDNVVHIGVTDSHAASRVDAAVTRWHVFIGHDVIGYDGRRNGPMGLERSD